MFIIFTEENSLLFIVFGIIYLSQCNTPRGVGVLPYLGYAGTCRWTGYGFWPHCPKQGMVLRAERLKPRLQAFSFFSSPATSGCALREVERVCDSAADKRFA